MATLRGGSCQFTCCSFTKWIHVYPQICDLPGFQTDICPAPVEQREQVELQHMSTQTHQTEEQPSQSVNSKPDEDDDMDDDIDDDIPEPVDDEKKDPSFDAEAEIEKMSHDEDVHEAEM